MQHKGGHRGLPCSLQLGDMGIGFPEKNQGYERDGLSYSPELGQEHKFIRGNHDDPALCRKHCNYAGDWEYFRRPNIFVVSGGFSIDHAYRIKNIDWWEDEELNDTQLDHMFESYKKFKPRIVATHECPTIIKKNAITNYSKLNKISRTEEMLQNMFDWHKPEFWIFGHHHKKIELSVDGVKFIGLNELLYTEKLNDCIYEIPNVEWG